MYVDGDCKVVPEKILLEFQNFPGKNRKYRNKNLSEFSISGVIRNVSHYRDK